MYDIYQSNGACFDQCKENYAFAVVQWQSCWCSNYIPADQQSLSSCNEECPGYPDDLCGNRNQHLYGYIPLSKAPSGTAGFAHSTQAPTSTPDSSTQQESVSTSYGPPRLSSSDLSSTSIVSSSAFTSTSYDFTSSTSSEPTSSPSITSTTSNTIASSAFVLTSSSLQSSSAASQSSSATPSTEAAASSTSTPETSSDDPATSYVSQTVVQTVTQSQSASILVSYVTHVGLHVSSCSHAEHRTTHHL